VLFKQRLEDGGVSSDLNSVEAPSVELLQSRPTQKLNKLRRMLKPNVSDEWISRLKRLLK